MPTGRRVHVLLDGEPAASRRIVRDDRRESERARILRHSDWARADRERLAALGIDDGEALIERGRHHALAAAFRRFDAFWQRART